MVEDEFPRCRGGAQAVGKPAGLYRTRTRAVRFVDFAVHDEGVNNTVAKVVIPFVSWQRKIREVIAVAARRHVVVISQGRKESIGGSPCAIRAPVVADVFVKVFPDVVIDIGRAVILIVADGNDEIRLEVSPDKARDRQFVGVIHAIVSNDGKPHDLAVSQDSRPATNRQRSKQHVRHAAQPS